MIDDDIKVSVLVPTRNRHWAFPKLLRCIAAQTIRPHEVLISDGSSEPYRPLLDRAPEGVRYMHAPNPDEVIGEKRNLLCSLATGDVIVFFDDDDFYHSTYIEWMLAVMRKNSADLVKLLSFFCYHTGHRLIGQFDLRKRQGLVWDWNGPKIEPRKAEDMFGGDALHLGYSANYVFARSLWEKLPFQSVKWNEDGPWIAALVRNGEVAIGVDDVYGRHLHLCHGQNLSICFPCHLEQPQRLAARDPEIRAFLIGHGAETEAPSAVTLCADPDHPNYDRMVRSPLQTAFPI